MLSAIFRVGISTPLCLLVCGPGGRFPSSELLPYIIAQVIGAIVAAGLIYVIAMGQPGFELTGSNPLATNGFGEHSPGGYNLLSCLVTEVVLTFIFLFVILGATDRRAPAGFAPIAIGMALTLIHLISIPITNTSVNPARSLGPALFAGGCIDWSGVALLGRPNFRRTAGRICLRQLDG